MRVVVVDAFDSKRVIFCLRVRNRSVVVVVLGVDLVVLLLVGRADRGDEFVITRVLCSVLELYTSEKVVDGTSNEDGVEIYSSE